MVKMSSRRGTITISYQCGCLSSYLLGMGFHLQPSLFATWWEQNYLFVRRLKGMLFLEKYLNSEPNTEEFTAANNHKLMTASPSHPSTSCQRADKHNFKSIQTVLCNTLLLLCNKIEKHSTVASAVVGNVFKPAFKLLSSNLSLPPTFHHVYLCNNAYRGPQVNEYGFIKSQILDCRLQKI